MAEYLPPLNNYPIFDSTAFFTTGFITLQQALLLFCNAPTAQGGMTFTGLTSIGGTATFNAGMYGTTIPGNITKLTVGGITSTTNTALTTSLNTKSCTASGAVNFNSPSTILVYTGVLTTTFSGGISLTSNPSSYYSNNTYSTTTTYYNSLSNLNCASLTATAAAASPAIISFSASTSLINNVILTAGNAVFGKLYVDPTQNFGRYIVRAYKGAFNFTYSTLAITTLIPIYNIGAIAAYGGNSGTAGGTGFTFNFTNALSVGNYMVFITATQSGGASILATIYSKNTTNFSFFLTVPPIGTPINNNCNFNIEIFL